ncbi:MAG: hypothetical protein RBT25_09860 [Lentisphaeria bacterium]|nr:hypothetical protein [Lentisphaeria bacterium]
MRFLFGLLFGFAAVCQAGSIHWSHGSWDEEAPAGKLLSENEGWWGDCVLTGVEYSYQSQPSNPPDRHKGESGVFGRRLLDGRFGGDWYVPVGQNRGPLVVVFDFKRPCVFNEVDIYATRSNPHSFVIEVAANMEEDGWQNVYEKPLDKEDSSTFYRAKMPESCHGRYLRLSFKGTGITWLDEVLVWGEAEVSETYPEHIRPVLVPELPPGKRYSLPGIASSVYSMDEFQAWRQSLGDMSGLPALWASIASAQPNKPVLPENEIINQPLVLDMAQNESECRYLTLSNPGEKEIRLRLSSRTEAGEALQIVLLGGGVLPVNRPKRKLSSEEMLRLFVTGNLPPDAEPEGDMQVLPFFAPGQQLGRSLMKRHLANAEALLDFPEVLLPPGGSMVLMLKAISANCPPGSYGGSLIAASEDGRNSVLPLAINVLPLPLPLPELWVRAWGTGTRQFPFESRKRMLADALSVRQLGATIWSGLPEAGGKAEMFGQSGETTFYHVMMKPAKYIHLGHGSKIGADDLDEKAILEIKDEARKMAAHVNAGLGLNYNQWFVELWDEPGEGNAALYGALARIIKEADANIRIYMNPLFWRPGFPPQELILEHLKEYYNQVIDISVPITNLVGDNLTTRELWSRPRQVRAHYLHPARRAGRGMAWKSFRHGFNGWGYYCYYAPRGNPWDISTWTSLGYSYQMVFPGPEGPITTPIYETMREGWEDYRLLYALQENNKTELLDELKRESSRRNADLQSLRARALEAFR